MPRITLLSEREGLTAQQQDVFDWIVESRGRMLRPYEVLLYIPGLAQPTAELGHQIRYEGSLSDHDRELAIITVAKVHKCEFEWNSHVSLARDAGVAEDTITSVDTGNGQLNGHDELIVRFVQELCANSNISDQRFKATEAAIGPSEVIELSALVGYYTLLGFVMNVAGAC